MSELDYQKILQLVQKSECKTVADGEYEIKLVKDDSLEPYSKKKFLVEISSGINEWTGGLWVTQTIFRQADKGLWNLISHADGHCDDDKFEPSKQMACEVLASFLHYILRREKKHEK